MAKKDAKKKAAPVGKKPEPAKETDSADTVTVPEQINVVGTANAETLAKIEKADRRPGVVGAIKARRELLRSREERSRVYEEMKAKAEAKKEAERAVVPPPAAAEAKEPAVAPKEVEPYPDEVAAIRSDEPLVDKCGKAVAPVAPSTALEGGVLGSQGDEAEDAQEYEAARTERDRVVEQQAKEAAELKYQAEKAVAAKRRDKAIKAAAEAKKLADLAVAAEAGVEPPKLEPKPAPKAEEPKVETTTAGSSPPDALLGR